MCELVYCRNTGGIEILKYEIERTREGEDTLANDIATSFFFSKYLYILVYFAQQKNFKKCLKENT